MKSLGNRMKENYEDRYRFYLTRRTPVILRLDGKAFTTLTKSCDKPFDEGFISIMRETAETLVCEIQGAKIAYVQSDEISLLLTDYDTLTTEAWFDYNIQKMVSVASAIATHTFSEAFQKRGLFDCRAFNIPCSEVCNYFIWRQQDWTRNSIQMLARSLYSHKECYKKKSPDLHEMCFQKGQNWAELPFHIKNGSTYHKELGWIDCDFIKDRGFVDKYCE